MRLYKSKEKTPLINIGKRDIFVIKNIRVVLALLSFLIIAMLLCVPWNIGVAAADSLPTLSSVAGDDGSVILTDGESCVLINGKIVQVGDQGKGWIYKSEDTLQLTGGNSISSILVTDNLKNADHLIGSRKFTIEVIGTNTITASRKRNKTVEIQYPGGTYNELGNYTGASITVPDEWGITVMGNINITGKGALNLVNTSGSSISEFIYAFGNITVKGPSIFADMNAIDTYAHVMTAYGFSLVENKQMGLITFASGSLEIQNAGSGISPLYGYDGLKLGSGVTIVAGKTKQTASLVTLDNFWNFEDWGVKVGPDPKKYRYIHISNIVTAPDKSTISSVTSTTSGKAVVKLKKVAEASGYEILYSTSSKFTATTTKKTTTNSLTKTLTKLVKGKTYYVKVRAYKVNSAGKYVYGAYSSVKKVVVKK